MPVQTCYLFTETEIDKSHMESLIEPYKTTYSAFILDSQELNACLIPTLDQTSVEQSPADAVDVARLMANPPDIFIVDTPVELGVGITTQHLTKTQYTHSYTERLNKAIMQYADKKGTITAIVCLTNDTHVSNQKNHTVA